MTRVDKADRVMLGRRAGMALHDAELYTTVRWDDDGTTTRVLVADLVPEIRPGKDS